MGFQMSQVFLPDFLFIRERSKWGGILPKKSSQATLTET